MIIPTRVWIKLDEPTSMGPVVCDYEPGSEVEFRRAGWFLYRLTESGVGSGDGGADAMALDVAEESER